MTDREMEAELRAITGDIRTVRLEREIMLHRARAMLDKKRAVVEREKAHLQQRLRDTGAREVRDGSGKLVAFARLDGRLVPWSGGDVR